MTKRLLAIIPVAALVAALQLAAPAYACACGAPAPRPGQDVVVDKELAILSWDGDQERIELLLDMLTDSDDVGLIFPTPAPATVTSGDRETFADIEEAIAPKPVYVDQWWPNLGYGAGAPDAGGAPTVLDQVQLGPVQATTLAADDATGLTDWLDTNGYAIRDEIAEGLQEYVDKGWYFVALKLTSDAPLDGMLDPVRFTFDSNDLVYPMALSQRATTLQQARLYVFDTHRTRIAGIDEPTETIGQASTTWAGTAPDAVADLGAYLTVVDLYFPSPASQIPGDLVAVQAGDDEPLQPVYTVTRPVTVFGIPFGVVAILGAVAGIIVLIALGTLVARLFRRRKS